LSEINPIAAAKFLPHQEAGSFFDKIANDFYLKDTVCDRKNVKTKTDGYGFWSNRMTGSTLNHPNDPKPLLRKNNLPVLILRGQCDYLKEAVAHQYLSVFSNATLKSFEAAGHMIYWESPGAFLSAVREFLREQY